MNDNALAALLHSAQTIEADGGGLKVAQLAGGDFLKLFRRKRWLSSALWAPPAARFAQNAQHLLRLGIAAPPILDVLRLAAGKSAVRYRPLCGQTLRARWAQLEAAARALEVRQFGAFLALLHAKGVYFRSLHLGNVLHLEGGGFGLIDLADMRISHRALPLCKRRRNLKHLLRYGEDSKWLLQQHASDWLQGYAQGAGAAAAGTLKQALGARLQAPQAPPKLPSSAAAR